MRASLAAARAGEPGVRIPRGGRGTLTERREFNKKIPRATFQTIMNW